MNQYIAKKILHFITISRGQPLFNSIDFLEKSQYWSMEKLLSYQKLRLNQLLEHCYINVPYYHAFFHEKNIKPSDITISNLNLLPLVTKSFLRKNLHNLTSQSSTIHPMEMAKTSGSTGIALKFPKSLKASAMQLAAMYRGHQWHGVNVGAKEARLWGIPVTTKQRYKVQVVDWLLNRFREKEYNLSPEILEDFCRRLKARKPEYLMGYTSMVIEFAKYLERVGRDGSEFNFKMVKCTSETIHDGDNDLIKHVFSCPLVGEYGAAETGIISFQCEAGSHHLMSDCSIVEFLEPEENIGDPSLKEIVVTNLDNYALPIIRYRVGDFVLPSIKVCTCGRNLPIVEKIIGRVSSIIKSENGKTWHSIILYYIMKSLEEKYGGVVQFKVEQENYNCLRFFLVIDDSFTEASKQYILKKCAETFGDSMKIELSVVPDIPRAPSGKLCDFVSSI